MLKEKISYLNRRQIFSKQANFDTENVSNIWKVLRKDFNQEYNHFRGYGISMLKHNQTKLYLSLSRIVSFPFLGTNLALVKIKNFLLKILSWILLDQDCNAAMRFGFDTYPTRIYSLNDMTNFLNKYSKYKISFSHNTFKSFYYLEQLKKNVQLNVEGDFKIFEIGAGLFNFGHLLSYELNKFEYVICDLPELILCAHKQITEIYLPQLSGNYNVYLPNELDLFDKCKSERKVLFITPEQLDKGVLGHDRKFDLFINHESFSEMNIDIVNKYLRYVSILMKKGSIINLVNRHTRPQAKLDEEFKLLSIEEITCFEDYELSFCDVITKQVCTFRAQIPVQQTLPNIFFIGKINQ